MLESHSHKIIRVNKKKKNFLGVFSTAISILFIIAGIIGVIFIQNPLKESQDIRQEASVEGGQVQISSTPTTGAELEINKPVSIQLLVNTNAAQIIGIQTIFNVVGGSLDNLTFGLDGSTNLSEGKIEIEGNATSGYLVGAILPDPPSATIPTFGVNQPTVFAKLSFTPTATGSVEINFDREKSYALLADTYQDSLSHVPPIRFTVIDPDLKPPVCLDEDALNYNEEGECEYPPVCTDPKATNYNKPGACEYPPVCTDPKATNYNKPGACTFPPVICTDSKATNYNQEGECKYTNTGGITIKSCNEECKSNSECAVNNRCYNGRCRLVTNVSSTTCTQLSQNNNPTYASCNQNCGSSGDCQAGLVCFETKCRRPDNPDNTSCAQPSATVITRTISSCNGSCANNSDCASNLRCYQGSCRLATNPSSSTCSAINSTTVSSTIYTNPTTPKGGTATTSGSQTGTSSAVIGTIRNLASSTPKPSVTPFQEPEKSALQSLQNMLSAQSYFGVPLPYLLIGAGVGIFLLVLISALLANTAASRNSQQHAQKQVTKAQATNTPAMQELQTKIQQAKTSAAANPNFSSPAPVQPQTPTTFGTTLPATPVPVASPAPMPIVPAPSMPTAPSTPQAPEPSIPAKPSTMVSLLKSKGVILDGQPKPIMQPQTGSNNQT